MLVNKGERSVDLPALLGDIQLDLQLLLLQLIAAYRRRINTEEKAKVVAAVLGKEFIFNCRASCFVQR